MAEDNTGQLPEGGAPGGQGAGGPPVQPQQVSWEAGGQKYSHTMDELQKGFMMHGDYTKKTQALSERERQYEARVLDDATRLYEAAIAEERAKGGKSPDGDPSAGAEPRTPKEVSELRARMERMEHERDQDRYNRELTGIHAEVKKEFSSLSEKQWKYILAEAYPVLASGKEDPLTVIKNTAKEFFDSWGKERDQAVQDFIKKKSEAPNKGEMGGSGMQTAAGKPVVPVKSFEEARARAEERAKTAV